MSAKYHKERRNARRIKASLPVRLLIKHNGDVVNESSRLENVSAGGAYFGCDGEVRPGDELHISISVPQVVFMASPPAEIAGSATVVWRNEESPPPGKRSGIGVCFNGDLSFRVVSEWPLLANAATP